MSKLKNSFWTNYRIKILNNSGKVIGSCNVWTKDSQNHQGEIGYILNKKFWRLGYGREVANALVIYGFDNLNYHRISANCFPENLGSKILLEKIGFKYEGHIREEIFIRDKWRDSLIYSILKSEYLGRKSNN